MKSAPTVLFRCDGTSEIGLGHVVRCLALADELHNVHRCRVAFAMRQGPLGFGVVQQNGYSVLAPTNGVFNFDPAAWLEKHIRDVEAKVLVLDVRDDLPRWAVESLRQRGILIVTLDDPSDRRLAADLAFYPPVPQIQRLAWDGFTGQLHVGWEWVVLRREFADRPSKVPRDQPMVLVTMGGSDPAGLTLKAVRALDLLDDEFAAVVVLGAGFCHRRELEELLMRARRSFDVRENISDMCGLMAQADLAVASFGITAYELAAMGVPAVYLCLTADHAESAEAFMEAGMAWSMGRHDQVSCDELARGVAAALRDQATRLQMSESACRHVDGRGVVRVSRSIVEAANERHG